MKYEDDDLKNLLKPLSKTEPSQFEINRWKKAIKANQEQTESQISFTKFGWMAQLVAATLFGVVLSSIFFKKLDQPQQNNSVQIISLNDATFERSHIKLD